MTAAQAKALVARLAAAYPRAELQQATVNLYAQHLQPLPAQVGGRVVDIASATHTWLPSLAELLQVVAELHVGAPDLYTAWEQVNAHAQATVRPAYEPCVLCDASGYTDPANDVLCTACRGQGERRVSTVPLHPLVEASLRHMGGPRALLDTREPGIWRTQWERAYQALVLRAHNEVRATGNWALPGAHAALPGAPLGELAAGT